MQLLVVTGFLGSGKTSLIVGVARAALELGRRVAIVVNEVGEIGVDGLVLDELDLDVWEIANGCICCTLSSDLVATLHDLAEGFRPDLVVVEPSGVAEPGNILAAMPYYDGPPLERVTTTCVVDPTRIDDIYEVLSPLITKQIAGSQLVVLTKPDLASEDEMEGAQQIIARINPSVRAIPTDTGQPLSQTLLGHLIP